MKLLDQVTMSLEETLSFDRGSATFKHWTIKYRNSLPDSAFAAIEPAYIKGDTSDKRSRHLPYIDKDGKIDEPHLQNALARVNQIKPFTNSITTADLRKKAMATLAKAKKTVGWD